MSASRDAQSLLSDPQVQAVIARCGQGLENPEVVRAVADAAVRTGLNRAQDAMAFAQKLSKDPAVQAQASSIAKAAGQAAMAGVAAAASGFMSCIEQGPAGVRLLACLGGAGSLALSGLSLLNPLTLVFGPARYVIGAYQALFSLTTVLYELPQEQVEQLPGITRYQSFLRKWCPFLSVVGGRGLFYIFQGSLWLSMAGITNLVTLGLGFYLSCIGALHLAMHFGVTPLAAVRRTVRVRGVDGMDGYAAIGRREV